MYQFLRKYLFMEFNDEEGSISELFQQIQKEIRSLKTQIRFIDQLYTQKKNDNDKE